MKLTFFKTRQPKRFNYKPRHWDKEKEDLEKRKASLGINSELSRKEHLKAQIEKKWKRGSKKPEKNTFSIRRLIYLVVLFLVVYLIFFTNFVYNLIALFGAK
ncbi:MAG: hypothetical protein ACEPOV_01550 [Hyphomicrobiales bacterium]